MNMKHLIWLTSLLGALSVGIGAFGAHGLRQLVDEESLRIFETGIRYQFYHTFAVGIATSLYAGGRVHRRRVQVAVVLWLVGMLLFSGSLYLLCLQDYHSLPVTVLGPITPVGGLFLIAGWLYLLTVAKGRPSKREDEV